MCCSGSHSENHTHIYGNIVVTGLADGISISHVKNSEINIKIIGDDEDITFDTIPRKKINEALAFFVSRMH
jgi:hypothetical protein